MAERTVEDLQRLRETLVERRRQEAYWIGGAHDEEHLAKLVQVHLAIQALDAVIMLGDNGPDSGSQVTIV